MAEKVVLAYSGGLDTSIIIPWLKENYAYDVIAMVGDVGQGDDIEAVVEKAYKTGASKVVVEDMREEFLTGYVFPALRAGAVYEHKYLLGTSLARPVIAKHQVEVALREGATAVAHGCTGKGNDQVRFELAYQALAPELKVIAPWREWTLKSREDCLDYAEKRGISVTASREKIHSRDRNLWHISHEGGELEDAGNAPLPSTWQLTRSPQEAPDREEQVVIGFEKGTPVSVNGMKLDPVSLVELLNEIGGRNAIGRIDLVENRFVGIKSRGCYETPGGTLLIAAHRELEALCLERDLMHFKQHIALKYAELAYFGLWFTPLREALDAFVDNTQQDITGTTTLALYKGNVSLVSRQSENSLYRTDLSSFTMGDSYDQKDAEGFIRILGLPSRSRARLRADAAKPEVTRSRGDTMKMWSGRFRQPLDADFERWQRSFDFDRRLLREELAASRAHASALKNAGILSAGELIAILQGLKQIGEKAAASPAFLEDNEAEDIHHFVEKQLVALIGDTGYKLHSGRSRNEQIATDLRLYVRASIDQIRSDLAEWLSIALDRAEQAGNAAMPAYTHLQRAEPVLVAHWLLAYVEMFLRDADRLADCRKRLNLSPLGSGAVAGATLPLDRRVMADELGFDAPTANSIDATSDRDFVLEFVGALSLLAVHLSRWAEEMILFSSQEFGFVRLPEAYSTGSSAMPQKMNPDLLELTRGKAARIIGDATALLVTVKGLPLAYNKDLQETQQPLFDAAGTVLSLLPLASGWMRAAEFNHERMQAAAESGFMNAWAGATYLVRRGVPFRLAHEQIGKAVQTCIERHCELADLPLEELRQLNPAFDQDFYSSLSLQAVLAIHDVPGGTAPARVRQAIADARRKVASMQEDVHAHA